MVRSARDGKIGLYGRLLPSLGRSADRRRDGTPAAHRRPWPRDGPDPHRPQVDADECHAIGLANYLCDDGEALQTALGIARDLTRFPQACMRADRMSAIRQWSLAPEQALAAEWRSVETFRQEGMAARAASHPAKGARAVSTKSEFPRSSA
jgi:hypothetical protein